MLYRKSRRLLSYIVKTEKSHGTQYFADALVSDKKDILEQNIKLNSISLNDRLTQLVEYGYIEYSDKPLSGIIEGFYLTAKGRNYKEEMVLHILEFVFKSLLTPIIVALLTTIITIKLT